MHMIQGVGKQRIFSWPRSCISYHRNSHRSGSYSFRKSRVRLEDQAKVFPATEFTCSRRFSGAPKPAPSPRARRALQRRDQLYKEMDEQGFTIDEAFEAVGFGRFQLLILLYAGMSWMAEAMEMMLLSFVGPAVQVQWSLSPREESTITSVVFAGMMIGAYTWGVLSDSKGRRTGFFVTAVLTFVAGFLSSLSPDFYSLLILRSLVGVGLGGGPVVSSWFLEFIPSPNRGMWMVVFSVFWTVGSLVEAVLAWVIMPTLGWRWLLGFSSLPLLILLVFYPLVPESPRYYAARGDGAKALEILKKVAALNGKSLPPGRLEWIGKGDHGGETAETELEVTELLSDDKPVDVDLQQNTTREMPTYISTFTTLLSPSLIQSTILLWLVFFANAFTYYGLVLLASQMSSQAGVCSTDPLPLKASEPLGDTVYRDVLITSSAELPGLAVAAAMVDYYGRKTSMSVLFVLCTLCLLPLLHHQPEGFTTFCLFGARACIMGAFTILYVYAPEVYPTSSRATGLGTANSFARIGGMLCPFVAVALVKSCHQSLAIVLFSLVSLSAAVTIYFFPIETKGRALTDVVRRDNSV